MDKIYVVCSVCADFFSPGGSIFRILHGEVGVVTEAPAWIKETITFKMLSANGLIYVTGAPEVIEENPVEKPMKAPYELHVETPVEATVEVPEIIEEVIDVPSTPKKRKKKSDAE